MKARGASRIAWKRLAPRPSLPTAVQSMTTICSPSDAHSRKQSAMRPAGPAVMARTTRGSTIAAA